MNKRPAARANKNAAPRLRKIKTGASEQRRYAWRGAINDLKRTPIATFLTVMVIAISLTLPTLCFIIYKNISHAAVQYYPSPQITAYLDKTLSDKAAEQLAEKIHAEPGVASVSYLTRQQALDEFRDWSGFSSALNLLDSNPLPAVVIATPKIDLQNTSSLNSLRQRISQLSGVNEVRMDDSWFNRLTALTHLAGRLVMVIGVLMVAAVFLVIGNSVRLTIFARRASINVQKLIGATDGFILRPFLYGGTLLGLAGACVALLVSSLLVWRLSAAVNQLAVVFGTQFPIKGLSFDEGLLILLVCAMVGWLAAWMTTVQHLRRFITD